MGRIDSVESLNRSIEVAREALKVNSLYLTPNFPQVEEVLLAKKIDHILWTKPWDDRTEDEHDISRLAASFDIIDTGDKHVIWKGKIPRSDNIYLNKKGEMVFPYVPDAESIRQGIAPPEIEDEVSKGDFISNISRFYCNSEGEVDEIMDRWLDQLKALRKYSNKNKIVTYS